MERFRGFIKKLQENENIPENLKDRIINEITADMNDMFDFLIKKGASEHIAEKTVLEKYSLSDDIINEFVSIYRSPSRNILRAAVRQARPLWGKLSLFLLILIILYSTGVELFSTDFYINGSIFIWPVMVFSLIALLFTVIGFNKIFITKDPDIESSKRALSTVIFFSGLGFFTGITGFCIEMFNTAEKGLAFDPILFFIAAVSGSDTAPAAVNAPGIISKCAGLMMLSMFVLIFFSFIWLIMNNQLVKIEYLIYHPDKNDNK